MTASDGNKLTKFLKKEYRDSYLDTFVRSGIAHQVHALRKKLGLTQSGFAKRIGKPQSVISRLEDELYGRVNLTTLLDVAKALDIGLLVRFVDYEEVLVNASRMSESDLQPNTIYDTVSLSHKPVKQSHQLWPYRQEGLGAQQASPRLGLGTISEDVSEIGRDYAGQIYLPPINPRREWN